MAVWSVAVVDADWKLRQPGGLVGVTGVRVRVLLLAAVYVSRGVNVPVIGKPVGDSDGKIELKGSSSKDEIRG